MPQNILITGCSSGFGRLTSETLARAGHRVFASMRDVQGRNSAVAEELRGFAADGGGSITVVEIDVTSDASVEAGVASVLAATGGQIDVVVNNAGIGMYGLAESFSSEQMAHAFNVNVIGIQRVNRATLPAMRARGQGLLVHISSVLGRLVIPVIGAYGATKFAVEGLVETYRYELAPLGVEAVLVEPAGFATNIGASALPPDAARTASYGPVGAMAQQFLAGMGAMLSAPGMPPPQVVADAIAGLVAMPAGERPARTVVDPNPQGVEAINGVCAQVQAGLLGAMGMAGMLKVTPRQPAS